jgi:hypothetical protein
MIGTLPPPAAGPPSAGPPAACGGGTAIFEATRDDGRWNMLALFADASRASPSCCAASAAASAPGLLGPLVPPAAAPVPKPSTAAPAPLGGEGSEVAAAAAAAAVSALACSVCTKSVGSCNVAAHVRDVMARDLRQRGKQRANTDISESVGGGKG